jgi:hypothetical protein
VARSYKIVFLKTRVDLAQELKGKHCLMVAASKPMARLLLKPYTNDRRFARANVFSMISIM